MEKLIDIVSKILNINKVDINDNLTRNVSEGWDSFNHLLLISEIEQEIGIKFTISEVEKIRTYGDLKKILNEKNNLNDSTKI